ncbi:hepatocyte growth factor-regulated tyrosine kinase substrate isoform X2 [Jatropha curcas]|uniref:hepatocyte growth factor-regulated tyrosine kinase substrate isoform X2 n=1 Tax=Jatropha curcas TaxID=180498 RepID=UPI0009D75F8C|nr:hepatocyte growth factor-regulated tyrosine kinase substrate isoform X2 [Jatropha curcas]
MALEPPPFQEADRCDVCKCSFSTFRRRHHCRCCGRTLCHEHSSNQMTLPQFGIQSNVRVCADCFNDSTRSVKVDPHALSGGVSSVTDKVSRLDIGAETSSKMETSTQHQSVTNVIECKCGMPLCICEPPAPTTDELPLQMKTPSTSSSPPNPKPKKIDAIPKNRGSTSNNKPSSVFNHGQITNGGTNKPLMDYEVNGEGLREAIKNGDTAAVKKLLCEGVDANYRDKQGLSVLHLAALFNRTDIAFTLMESGASLDYKNAQVIVGLDSLHVLFPNISLLPLFFFWEKLKF